MGQYDGIGRLYATDTWRPLGGPLEGHTQRITSVTFSADGAHAGNRERRRDGRALGRGDPAADRLAFDSRAQHLPLRRLQPQQLASVRRLHPRTGNPLRHRSAGLERPGLHVIAGGLTPEQWEENVPGQDYVSACPSG